VNAFRIITQVLRWLPLLALLPPGAYLYARWRGGFRTAPWMKGLVTFHVYDLVTTAITLTLSLLGRNNLGFANFDELVALIWILTLFRRWTTSPRARQVYGFAAASAVLWAGLGVLLSGSIFRFNDLFLTAQSLILAGASMVELARLLMDPAADEPLTAMPLFWVLSGLYLFSLGALAVHATGNVLLRSLPIHLIGYPWLVRAVLFYVYKAMVAKAFLCPQPTSS
jgi:hypothetical protein